MEYSEGFFDSLSDSSLSSASQVVPFLMRLVSPNSVVDVGCGTGEWLSILAKAGVADYVGIDGSWIKEDQLRIPPSKFIARDLTQPITIERTFDLVISLEVAEHLPQEYAKTFVESLVRLGPIVVFSAGVPLQGGRNHVNLQWPEYWYRLFAHQDYLVIDCLRHPFWRNEKVAWWYAQNMLLFVAESVLDDFPALRVRHERTVVSQLAIIHPELYLKKAVGNERYKATLRHRTIKRALRAIKSLPLPLQKMLEPVELFLKNERKRPPLHIDRPAL